MATKRNVPRVHREDGGVRGFCVSILSICNHWVDGCRVVTVAARFDHNQTLVVPLITISVVKASLIVGADSATCVTFPNDTSSCTKLFTCNHGINIIGNVTYDSFAINSNTQPVTHPFATCRVEEVCTGKNTCDIVEMVMTDLEPSICPDMCYYLSIPHGSCTAEDGNEPINSVVTMKLADDKKAIQIKRYKFTGGITDETLSPTCVVPSDQGGSDLMSECEISVDLSCPGTTVTSIEPGNAVQATVVSVDGEASVFVEVESSTLEQNGVTVLATVFKPMDEDKDVQLIEGDSVIVELSSMVIDIVFVDELGLRIQLGENETISLTFKSQRPTGYEERKCSFYNETKEKWSTYGCWVSKENDTDVVCTCNHTTSFAVLLQFEDCSIRGTNLYLQTLFTRFFNALSIGAMVLTVVVFVFLKLYSSDQVKVHISLAISLALTQTVMLFMDQTHNDVLCTAIAGIMHYLLSVYAVNMLQEGILLHRKASRTHKGPVKGWVIILTAWGIPAVLVAVLMGSIPKGYGSACACWLTVESGTMYVWLIEVCVVVLVNSGLLFIIMRTFVTLKANAKKTDTERLKATVRALLIMVPMLGMTWIFAILQAASKNIFLQYVFIIINALQGPLFFIFQCVLHHEVQKAIGRKRGKVSDKWAMSTSSSGADTMTTDKGTSHFEESKIGKGK
ncbi:adhesion G protein-coupled receptor E3-like [Diadema setosum]|uniref:adhesion G protein-coupled receptor E3-like n=1 Tax=Diadema setosum TaxID=31175 RepID=UPI003B3AC73A